MNVERRWTLAVRIALIAGFCIDFFVGVLCVAGQSLLEPLLGVATKDPAITAFLGGELIVASAIYVLVFLALPERRALLWICALDQFLGVVIPFYEIATHNVPATVQTLGPMPFQLVLVAIFLICARRESGASVLARRT